MKIFTVISIHVVLIHALYAPALPNAPQVGWQVNVVIKEKQPSYSRLLSCAELVGSMGMLHGYIKSYPPCENPELNSIVQNTVFCLWAASTTVTAALMVKKPVQNIGNRVFNYIGRFD